MDSTQLVAQAKPRPARPADTAPADRCTFCPSGCELQLASAGPDLWRVECPVTVASGLCPRGSSLGELLTHRRRILTPARGAQPLSLSEAVGGILALAGGGEVTLLLDGNIPCEQMLAAARWCGAWPRARLCFVMEPDDEQMLLGTEASGAAYWGNADLAECDGLLLVGDVFAANPVCSRPVFDRRKADSKIPLVTIDPGAGTCVKFATHWVRTGVAMEYAALWQVARAAGIETDAPPPADAEAIPSAVAAGKALANCRRLGVLLSAEYGRAAPWRAIGYLAGRIAAGLGGGVAPQTVGANALAALRMADRLKTISLAKALTPSQAQRGVWVALGCDLLGMLGWSDAGAMAGRLVAAAALPNRTTAAAEYVLPTTMTGESAGTFLLDGAGPKKVSALLPGPAGVLSPADLVKALAFEAGAKDSDLGAEPDVAERLSVAAPTVAETAEAPQTSMLLLRRHAADSGCGALTAHASWRERAGAEDELVMRICPQRAREMHLADLAAVTVRVGSRTLNARVQIAPELPDGVILLPEGCPEARALLPSTIDSQDDRVRSAPACVELDA